MLALDIGHTYLAYAYMSEEGSLTYGFSPKFKTDDLSIAEAVTPFFEAIDFHTVVIERQMWVNKKAMNVQKVLVGVLVALHKQVRLVYATEKFNALGLECVTDKKQHKKLSVEIALEWVETVPDYSDRHLSEFAKKDDLSDAINMLRTNLN
jgi:hypothetical protein